MNQLNMKNLLIAEMTRAIEIMENNQNISKFKQVSDGGNYTWYTVDREISELNQLFLSIRKHSISLEKSYSGR